MTRHFLLADSTLCDSDPELSERRTRQRVAKLLCSVERSYFVDRGIAYEELGDIQFCGVVLHAYASPNAKFQVRRTGSLTLLPSGFPENQLDILYITPWLFLLPERHCPIVASQAAMSLRERLRIRSRPCQAPTFGIDGACIMTERVGNALRKAARLLGRQHGVEAPASVLFSQADIGLAPFTQQDQFRLTCREVNPNLDEDAISADGRHVNSSTRSFVDLCRKAQGRHLVSRIGHRHPRGIAKFSMHDDRNEKELRRSDQNCSGSGTSVAGPSSVSDRYLKVRVWSIEVKTVPAQAVLSVRRQLRFHNEGQCFEDGAPSRQVRILGRTFNACLRQMTVGIVGCGATARVMATLSVRLGVGRLVSFNKDVVEKSSPNRLYGACRDNSEARCAKAAKLEREVTAMDVGTMRVSLQCWLVSNCASAYFGLCANLLGCSDDHVGRFFSYRCGTFYLRPLIAVGRAILISPQGRLREASGPCTVPCPSETSLVCRGIVDQIRARDGALLRDSLEEYVRSERKPYVVEASDHSRAVVTLTTEVACLALSELLQSMVNLRHTGRWKAQHVQRLDAPKEWFQEVPAVRISRVCVDEDYWIQRDLERFLERVP